MNLRRVTILELTQQDLLVDCYIILNRRKKNICQLLNIHYIRNVRLTEIQTDEPLLPELRALMLRLLLKSLKYLNIRYLSITAELMKAGCLTCVMRSVNLFIMFGIRNYCFTGGRSKSKYPFIRMMIKIYCSNCQCKSFLSTTCKYLSRFFSYD